MSTLELQEIGGKIAIVQITEGEGNPTVIDYLLPQNFYVTRCWATESDKRPHGPCPQLCPYSGHCIPELRRRMVQATPGVWEIRHISPTGESGRSKQVITPTTDQPRSAWCTICPLTTCDVRPDICPPVCPYRGQCVPYTGRYMVRNGRFIHVFERQIHNGPRDFEPVVACGSWVLVCPLTQCRKPPRECPSICPHLPANNGLCNVRGDK